MYVSRGGNEKLNGQRNAKANHSELKEHVCMYVVATAGYIAYIT